mmetsp:Transcript_78728/g.176054  ORF Transcript_78728/g.176054 Transcript_78728/m.176054 type:complete len:231 (-) Transcript_78728:266-958(-)
MHVVGVAGPSSTSEWFEDILDSVRPSRPVCSPDDSDDLMDTIRLWRLSLLDAVAGLLQLASELSCREPLRESERDLDESALSMDTEESDLPREPLPEDPEEPLDERERPEPEDAALASSSCSLSPSLEASPEKAPALCGFTGPSSSSSAFSSPSLSVVVASSSLLDLALDLPLDLALDLPVLLAASATSWTEKLERLERLERKLLRLFRLNSSSTLKTVFSGSTSRCKRE